MKNSAEIAVSMNPAVLTSKSYHLTFIGRNA
jgi:hypothetical protein